jgi:NitT/TauT family transport system permease protein
VITTVRHNTLKRVLSQALPPVALLLAVAAVWQAAVMVFQVPPFVLPTPLQISRAATENSRTLISATLVTGAAAICGFAASIVVGCLIAFAFSQSTIIRRSFYPYAIFLQTVPIVAIAPLIILWFGTGFQSVILVSFLVGLFPIITNMTTGLTRLEGNLVDLFRVYRASRTQMLVKLRLPAAVPYLITGAKTSSGLAVIGAIVGEFFAGYQAQTFGLGYLVIVTSQQLKTAELFAAILCSTVLGLIIFSGVSAAGNAILARWYQNQRQV